MNPSTVCARAGQTPPFVNRPSAPAIWQTTAFDVDGLEQLEEIYAGRAAGYIYTRDANPNIDAFAADVAALERTPAAAAAASGMGSMAAAVSVHVKAGDHLLAGKVLYGKTTQLLRHLQERQGVSVDWFDAGDPKSLRAALRPNTKMVIAESISNPLMEVVDIPALAEAAGAAPLLIDSTFATPVLNRPWEHGAKLVFHSASKYLGGHGDVMLGVIAGAADTCKTIAAAVSLFGSNANPFECWLASRGLRTLALRVQRASATAMELAEWLGSRPEVSHVYYPGLSKHPSHAVARRMLVGGFGGMLAFEVASAAAVDALFRNLAGIPFSPTLADARTTVSYPAGTSHRPLGPDGRAKLGIRDGLVRLSVGLEDAGDLKRELAAGLDALH